MNTKIALLTLAIFAGSAVQIHASYTGYTDDELNSYWDRVSDYRAKGSWTTEEVNLSNAVGAEISRRMQKKEEIELKRKIEESIQQQLANARALQALQASKAVAAQTRARTETEKYQIALEVLEKSKELQDYAVALAQSRKP